MKTKALNHYFVKNFDGNSLRLFKMQIFRNFIFENLLLFTDFVVSFWNNTIRVFLNQTIKLFEDILVSNSSNVRIFIQDSRLPLCLSYSFVMLEES